SLERQIKNSLSESNYLITYYHSEALSLLSHQLHNLYLFKDPLHNEKMHLEHLENSFKKRPEHVKNKDKVSWKRIKERWQERIQNDKLQLMAKEKDLNKFFYDSQEIDDALFS